MPKSDVSFLDAIGENKSNYTKGGAGAYSSVVKKLMTAFGEAVVGDLVANLKKNNSVASGSLESSINYTKPKALSNISQMKSLAFLIRRKIAREGIKATNFYSDVINEKTLNQFITVLKAATRRDILIQLSREK